MTNNNLAGTGEVRSAFYAGSFYPAEKEVLSKMISDFLKQANVQAQEKVKFKTEKESKQQKFLGKLKAIIVPHAGYIYSGATAAFAFKLIGEVKPKRIILLGPSHYDYLEGAFGFEGVWATPLGKTKVSKSGLNIIKGDCEHSLEVELPFLQSVINDFEFVPVIYGEINPIDLGHIASELKNEETVFVISSDLSHYLSYDLAKKIDNETISAILSLNLEKFIEIGDACGKTGIAALLSLAKKNNWKAQLLDYRNSGDTAGDKNGVVGYCAIAFFE